MLEDRLVPANIFVDQSPTINGGGNDVFTPVGGTDVAGLTLGVDLFLTVGEAVTAAAASGDDIMIANDANPYTEPLNVTIATDKSIDFFGVGSANPVLNNTAVRFFQFDGSNVAPVTQSLDRLTFTGGDTGGGIVVSAGFVNLPNVTITNASFVDNRAGSGGALGFGGGTVIVRASSFTSNSATIGGGAISFGGSGSLTLDGVTIGTSGNGNSAPRGGGIAISGSATVSFVNNASTVQFNSATTSGGGIDVNLGAAAVVSLGSLLTVSNNQTTGNGSLGGGIAMRGAADAALTINGVISANQANGDATSTGGGVAVSSGVVTIASTAVIGGAIAGAGNTTTGDGGGVAATGGSVTVNGSVLGNAAAGNGGGIAIALGTHTLTDATIGQNSATGTGGGIHQAGGTVVSDPTIYSGNVSAGDGAGINIVAGVFTLNAGDQVINNISTGGNGGGISVAGAATLNINGVAGAEVIIANNTALNTLAVAGKGNGGGISLAPGSTGTTTIQGAIIGGPVLATDANRALVNGGGIFVGGGTLLLNTVPSTIQNNTAGSGGGIAITNGAGHSITGAVIASNQALAASGGGINVNGAFAGTLTIVGSTIGGANLADGNVASTTGGGINLGAGNLTLSGAATTIQNNRAASGGGIAIATGTNTITDATISQNVATTGTGGGIHQTGGNLTLDPTTITGNTAAGDGGGVNINAGTLTLSAGAQVTNNVSTGGNGGGINVGAAATLNINGIAGAGNQVIIANNTALNTLAVAGKGNGGGISLAPGSTGTTTIQGALIGGPTLATDANRALVGGGGVFVGGGTLLLNTVPSTIQNNTAGSGGGIAISGGTGHSITGAVIASNQALATSGGGINVNGAFADTLTIIGSTIGGAAAANANTAAGDGGGINVSAGNLTLSGAATTIQNNTAANGGGIRFAGAALNLNGTLVTANRALTGAGGGLFIAAGTNTITDATVSANTAATTGGGIHQSLGSTTCDSTIITGNTAAGDGGGVNVIGGTFVLSAGDQVTLNTSTGGDGGGINYAGGINHSITGTIVAGNRANNTDAVATKGDGGGISLAPGFASTVTLSGDTIGGAAAADGNQALNGAGIAIAAGTLTFATALTTLQNNSAANNGGGIDLAPGYGGALTLNAFALVTQNVVTAAGGQGGGVANRGVGLLALDGTTVSANQASGAGANGGGIFSGGGNLTIASSTIGGATAALGNTAASSGGGIFVAGGTFGFTAGTVIRNNAATTGNGGGLFVGAAGVSSIADTTIASNRATAGSGGGIHVAGTFVNTLTISGLTLGGATAADGNQAGASGGGLNSSAGVGGAVNIGGAVNNVVRFNTATTTGGGINVASGGFTMTVATVQQNTANGNGGGLAVTGGANSVTRTTFAANESLANGGGIAVTAGTLSLDNCTISGNRAANGGGIDVAANTTIVNTTVAANTATAAIDGIGGIRQTVANTLTIQNSISGDNTGTGAGTDINVAGGPTTLGFNLFEFIAGFAPLATDITGETPLLALLADYGGPNQTMALLPGSHAIDSGTGASADQRGVAVVNAVKDRGAFESRGFTYTLSLRDTAGVESPTRTLRTIINTVFETPNSPGAPAPLALVTTVASPFNEPVEGGRVYYNAAPDENGSTATSDDGLNSPISFTRLVVDAAGKAATTVRANAILTVVDATPTYQINVFSSDRVPPATVPPVNVGAFELQNRGVDAVTMTPISNAVSGQVLKSLAAGPAATPVLVQLIDQYGTPITLATDLGLLNPIDVDTRVTMSKVSGAGTLTGTLTQPTNPSGVASFADLSIIRADQYVLRATVRKSLPGNVTAFVDSNTFRIIASDLVVDAPDKVRSGVPFTVTVTAVGEDGVIDPFFTEPITLGLNASTPSGSFNPNPAPTANAVAGSVTFNNVTLGRAGTFKLNATSNISAIVDFTSAITSISGADAGTTKVNASVFRVTNFSNGRRPAVPAGAPTQGFVRSSNQVSIVSPNDDNLVVTVQGFDIEGNDADIEAAIDLSIQSAVRFVGGMVVPIPGPTFGGVTAANSTAGNRFTFGTVNSPPSTINARLTLDKWGDYYLRATITAANGAGDQNAINRSALSGNITVYARQMFLVNPPFLVVGNFSVTTQARDVTGDLAQNYTGGSDPARLTITNFGGSGGTGIVARPGTTGGNDVFFKNPTNGTAIFDLRASRPVLISLRAVDNLEFFLDSSGVGGGGGGGGFPINPLDTGRRRPRPMPPQIIVAPRIR